jgi:hypothetical protein
VRCSNLTEHFWQTHLVPAAEALRAQEVRFFTPADAGSTWVPLADDTPDLFTVERATLPADLRARWADHAALLALIEPLVALADAVTAQQAEAEQRDAADVSPYMYVMF